MDEKVEGVEAVKTVWYQTWQAKVVYGIFALGFIGSIHIVHGDNGGIHTCWKDGWTPLDTFVDLDDINNASLDQLEGKGKIFRALKKCGIQTEWAR